MKKRLLITSIVMLVIVSLALSTATYAWFTSNTTVTASSITLTAESGAGTALGIGWLGGTTGTSITVNEASRYNPMIPSELDVDTTNFEDITWSGATFYTDNDVLKFNAPYNPAPTPYLYSGTIDENIVDIFYIENLSIANTISTITLTLSGVSDINSLLRVALFTSDSYDGDYILKAVFGKEENLETEWGVITEAGQEVETLCEDKVLTVSSLVLSTLEPQSRIYFKAICWLDGVMLDDTTANSTSTFGLTFLAE